MEVSGSDRNRVIWEVVDDHYVEYPNENDDIRLQGFLFFWCIRGGGGGVR